MSKDKISQFVVIIVILILLICTVIVKKYKDISNNNSVEIVKEELLLDISGDNKIEIGIDKVYTLNIKNNYGKTVYLDIDVNIDPDYLGKISYQTTINGVKQKKEILDKNVFSNIILKDYNYNINIEFFKEEGLVPELIIYSKFEYHNKIINNLATDYLINNGNLTKINSNYEVTSDDKDILEYRYTGIDSNNYVWFNCVDGYNNSDTYCEKWRIIGLFNKSKVNNGTKYLRMYIVKDKALNNMMDINTNLNYLNTTYYNSINPVYKEMIMPSLYNFGDTDFNNNVIENYKSETKKTKLLNLSTIGLSDLGFATDIKHYDKKIYDLEAVTNSWLSENNYMFATNNKDGLVYKLEDNVLYSVDANNKYYMLPAAYLNPLVLIDGGNGTKEMPYILKLNNYIDYFK